MEEITKLAGAKEQLITAINLYFEDKRPASTHTLIRAAHTVLDNISAYKKLERGITHQGLILIKPEFHKQYWAKINECQNFFKHADKDPDPESTIKFNPELSAYYIHDAISLYVRITNNQNMPCEMISFQLWFKVSNPHLWDNQVTEFDSVFKLTKELLHGLNRTEAYNLLIKACEMSNQNTL